MPTNLPGADLPNPPALPGSGTLPPASPVPAWWSDLNRVAAFVLDLYATDPKAAVEFWQWARKTAGQQLV